MGRWIALALVPLGGLALTGCGGSLVSESKTAPLTAAASPTKKPPAMTNIAMTSGDTAGITDDCTSCSVSTNSIFGQVGPRAWRAYQESMPAPGFTGSEAGLYRKKHNPAAYYTKLRAAYAVNAVPLATLTAGALISDLRANRLPRYSYLTPNLCNDEHDCESSVGDAWLAHWVPQILASRAYRTGGTARSSPTTKARRRTTTSTPSSPAHIHVRAPFPTSRSRITRS
jgi:hypothetical protein